MKYKSKTLFGIMAILLLLYSISGMYCMSDSIEEEIETPTEEEVSEYSADIEDAEIIDTEEVVSEECDNTEDQEIPLEEKPKEELANDGEINWDTVSGNTALDEDGLPDEYIPHYREDLKCYMRNADCGAHAAFRSIEQLYFNKYADDICIDAELAEWYWSAGYGPYDTVIASTNRLIWHTHEKF